MKQNESRLRDKIARAEREAKARAEKEAKEAARIRAQVAEKERKAKKQVQVISQMKANVH